MGKEEGNLPSSLPWSHHPLSTTGDQDSYITLPVHDIGFGGVEAGGSEGQQRSERVVEGETERALAEQGVSL